MFRNASEKTETMDHILLHSPVSSASWTRLFRELGLSWGNPVSCKEVLCKRCSFFFWGGGGGVVLGICSVSFMQLCNGLVRSSCCVHLVSISRLVVFFQWTSCLLLLLIC